MLRLASLINPRKRESFTTNEETLSTPCDKTNGQGNNYDIPCKTVLQRDQINAVSDLSTCSTSHLCQQKFNLNTETNVIEEPKAPYRIITETSLFRRVECDADTLAKCTPKFSTPSTCETSHNEMERMENNRNIRENCNIGSDAKPIDGCSVASREDTSIKMTDLSHLYTDSEGAQSEHVDENFNTTLMSTHVKLLEATMNSRSPDGCWDTPVFEDVSAHNCTSKPLLTRSSHGHNCKDSCEGHTPPRSHIARETTKIEIPPISLESRLASTYASGCLRSTTQEQLNKDCITTENSTDVLKSQLSKEIHNRPEKHNVMSKSSKSVETKLTIPDKEKINKPIKPVQETSSSVDEINETNVNDLWQGCRDRIMGIPLPPVMYGQLDSSWFTPTADPDSPAYCALVRGIQNLGYGLKKTRSGLICREPILCPYILYQEIIRTRHVLLSEFPHDTETTFEARPVMQYYLIMCTEFGGVSKEEIRPLLKMPLHCGKGLNLDTQKQSQARRSISTTQFGCSSSVDKLLDSNKTNQTQDQQNCFNVYPQSMIDFYNPAHVWANTNAAEISPLSHFFNKPVAPVLEHGNSDDLKTPIQNDHTRNNSTKSQTVSGVCNSTGDRSSNVSPLGHRIGGRIYARHIKPGYTLACGNCFWVPNNDYTPIRCSNCWVTIYCSPECQTTHYPQHRELCRFKHDFHRARDVIPTSLMGKMNILKTTLVDEFRQCPDIMQKGQKGSGYHAVVLALIIKETEETNGSTFAFTIMDYSREMVQLLIYLDRDALYHLPPEQRTDQLRCMPLRYLLRPDSYFLLFDPHWCLFKNDVGFRVDDLSNFVFVGNASENTVSMYTLGWVLDGGLLSARKRKLEIHEKILKREGKKKRDLEKLKRERQREAERNNKRSSKDASHKRDTVLPQNEESVTDNVKQVPGEKCQRKDMEIKNTEREDPKQEFTSNLQAPLQENKHTTRTWKSRGPKKSKKTKKASW